MSILDYNYNGSTLTFDDRLIDLVRAHPAIYDVNDINYRRNSARQEIWHKISRMLGASSKICQVKWKNIRYNYLTEIKNPKNPNIRRRRLTRDLSFLKTTAFTYKKKGDRKSSDSSGYIYKPDNQDDFYEIVMVEPSEDESTVGMSSYPVDDEVDVKPTILADADLSKVTASDDTTAETPTETTPIPTKSPEINEVATSSVSDFRSSSTQRREEEWNQPTRRELDRNAPDAIEMYCLSLADSLRAMTRSERERVKFEFAHILKDAQYQDNN
ncbi:transcription factor Adf-1 [Episyrphus balteatus]|uniref:transcription factor Adf-1 n=1 Tax=Episyrphus balteatus TaxID=286459 RepID=UPI0024866C2D|nr:transcription factor Adf-1 [Episyrphus balteatus]